MDPQTFYTLLLPGIIGQEYDVARGYGHARYRILGNHGAWKSTRDAQKVYFRWPAGGRVTTVHPTEAMDVLCIAVTRLGGYSGPPTETLEMVLAKKAHQLQRAGRLP